MDCILFIGSHTWSPSKSLNMSVHQYKKQDLFQAFVCLVDLYFTSVTRNNSNRPFPLSRKQRHQLEAEVGKIQWFVWNCPPKPTPKFCRSVVFNFSFGHFNSQEKLKTMLMQNFGVTNKEHYGMLWYFLERSIQTLYPLILQLFNAKVAWSKNNKIKHFEYSYSN